MDEPTRSAYDWGLTETASAIARDIAPCKGKVAEHFRQTWERYTLSMDEEAHAHAMARRGDLADNCNRDGTWGRLRAFDRRLVRRYAL